MWLPELWSHPDAVQPFQIEARPDIGAGYPHSINWPKWSPDVGRANGKAYYWLTFSSQRTAVAQIYVSALVVDAAGKPQIPPIIVE